MGRFLPTKILDLLKYNLNNKDLHKWAWYFLPGFLIYFGLGAVVFGQGLQPRTSLQAGFDFAPARKISNSPYTFASRQLILGASVPLYRRLKMDDEPKFRMLAIQNQNRFATNDIGGLTGPVGQIRSSIGINYIEISRKNTWLVTAQAQYFFENDHPADGILRPTGMILWNRQVNKSWSYRLGALYSFAFGEGLALPVLGIGFKTGKKGWIQVTLPYRIQYTIKHKRTFRSRITLNPNGGINVLREDYGGTQDPTIAFLRSRAIEWGYMAVFSPNQNWSWQVGISVLGQRKVWISEGNVSGFQSPTNLFSGNVKAGLLCTAGIRLKLGKSKARNPHAESTTDPTEPADPAEPDLDDEDLQRMDLTDL